MSQFVLQSHERGVSPRIDYRALLNPEQLEAVENGDGPCLVLAGAGSGKTRTIIFRLTYLLEHGVQPENILLVTFTNKAAREMLNRATELLGDTEVIGKLWGGTFHHLANRLLRKYATMLGYTSNFTIMDEDDAERLLKRIIKQHTTSQSFFPTAHVVKNIISLSQNTASTIEDIIDLKHPKWLKIANEIEKIQVEYQLKKTASNLMDFDDLLTNWLRLLIEFPDVQKKLGQQFKYILVDEYQDTNYLQAKIIHYLASIWKNILAVGDDAQSIYSFRGADVENILNFPKDWPGCKIFKLQNNYRSSPEILKIANSVIINNLKQFPKNLVAMNKSRALPQILAASSGRQEAEFICQKILELQSSGTRLNDVAVLFRASSHSQVLELALNKHNLPYEYRGGLRFFERAHIKDALAYLKIINSPKDEISFNRVAEQLTGVGEKTAEALFKTIGDLSLLDFLTSAQNEKTPNKASGAKLRLANIFLNQLELEKNLNNPSLLLKKLLKSDYQSYLEANYPDFQDRLDDLEQLVVYAQQFDSLSGLVSELALQENFRNATTDQSSEILVLSTVHQAKGLEWPIVFVINLSYGGFPSRFASLEPSALEEERRLFYVAITRAQKELFLTYPELSESTYDFSGPSQFLKEIPPSALEEIELIEKRPTSGYNGPKQIKPDIDGISYLPDLDSL